MASQHLQALFPTREHHGAALYATEFFSKYSCVDAVLLTCSCARGKAAPGSCVDVSVLVDEGAEAGARDEITEAWQAESKESAVISALASHGKYAHVDVCVTDGAFAEGYHGWCSGPDEFELEIGNLLRYSVPMYQRGGHLDALKAAWLPYYSRPMQKRRFAMVREYGLNNIDHIFPFVDRELYFQSFRRLYNAAGEFMQALFISRSTYPIAYDKWVKEQIVDILGLPEVYRQLVDLLSVKAFESTEMKDKASLLLGMFDEYCPMPSDTGLHEA